MRELNRITLVKIVKVLGEGGFSFVYLAQDEASGVSASSCDRVPRVVTADAIGLAQKDFALKKIRCPTGTEGVELVMREVAAYRRFKCVRVPLIHIYHLSTPFGRHPNIIRLYVSKMRLHSQKWLLLTLCRIQQYCKTLAAKAKSSTSSFPSIRSALPRLVPS
jgi:serine/threonine protein kinase